MITPARRLPLTLSPLSIKHVVNARLFCMPDTHHCYHDQRAVDLYIKVVNKLIPDIHLIVGDFVDNYWESGYQHSRLPRESAEAEYDAANETLDAFPKSQFKAFLEGNHEERRYRTLVRETRIDYGKYSSSIENALKLEKRGWNYLRYREILKLGPIHWVHDIGPAGKTAIDASYNQIHHNLGFGHTHRGGDKFFGDVIGTKHIVMNNGHLCLPEYADYADDAAKKDWMLGFIHGVYGSNGIFYGGFVPIIIDDQTGKYSCRVDGCFFQV